MTALLLTHFIAIVSPGPNTLIAISSSKRGVRAIIMSALGITAAQLVHISYSYIASKGLSEVVSNSLGIVGAIYLIKIGFDTLVAKTGDEKGEKSSKGDFIKGFLVNVFNVKVAAYFLTIFPPLFVANKANALMTIIYISIMVFLWFTIVGVAVRSPLIFKRYLQYEKVVNLVSGALFIILGLGIGYSITTKFL